MPRIHRRQTLCESAPEVHLPSLEDPQGAHSLQQHHSSSSSFPLEPSWQHRLQDGLSSALQLVAGQVQQSVPHIPLFNLLPNSSPHSHPSPLYGTEAKQKAAFTHELQRDGGLVLGNGDKDRLRALLGLAVVNLAALGGSAQSLLSPQGPGGCDHNPYERCANCVTSAPFVVVGVHALRKRTTLDGKIWGASMMGVGMASCGFHASTGKWRTLGRRLDYWSIAMSSNMLLRAVVPNVPPAFTVASIALTPFKPFLVSFLNSAVMEYKFLLRANQSKQLQRTHRLHASTVFLSLGAFCLEEFFPRFPFIHSMWHCLSAASVATVNDLIRDTEEQRMLNQQATPLVL